MLKVYLQITLRDTTIIRMDDLSVVDVRTVIVDEDSLKHTDDKLSVCQVTRSQTQTKFPVFPTEKLRP